MMRIDSHNHFWMYDPVRDSWITDDMHAIQKDFLPEDFIPILERNNISGIVTVQASQSHDETNFLVALASKYPVIKAIVGWADLASEEIESVLAEFAMHSVIKGFRHVVEGEQDPGFLMREDIQRGIKALTKYNYTYDLLIRPRHFSSTLECVRQNPSQQFILDHMAKPNVKEEEIEPWRTFIRELAHFPNVACKISGLATEADWGHWELEHFRPYISHVVDCFGPQRLLYGSDWPVCEVAASYEQNMQIASSHLSHFSEEEKEAFWGGNAKRFYNF